MSWLASFSLILIVLAIHASAPAPADHVEDFYARVSPTVDKGCILKHCLVLSGRCEADKGCRKVNGCVKKCFDHWDDDTTSEKVHVQNCSSTCTYSYGSPTFFKFMQCAEEHKCIGLPSVPSQCRAPGKLTLLKKLSSDILIGTWWVVKGYHPVFDCYPCYHSEFKRMNATYMSYTPKYQAYLANGSLGLVESHFIFPNTTPGASIPLREKLGVAENQTWWLIDAAQDNSYVLVYYCGNVLQWYYDGALVLAKGKTLSDFNMANIAASYSRALGLNSAQFCSVKNTVCPD